MDPEIEKYFPETIRLMRLLHDMGTGTRRTYTSEDYQRKGNQMIKDGEYERAVELFNGALRYFPIGTKDIGLAYGNRSAVYCEMGKYALAIENIKLARENGFPTEKMAELEAREEKCEKLMEEFGPDKTAVAGASEFFKLSHPPNEKIPFIAGCLELHKNEKYGRHIVTTKDLKTGDIIAIEDPVVASRNESLTGSACFFCLKMNSGSLLPCDHCAKAMFCSEECRKKASPLHLNKGLNLARSGIFETVSLKMQFEACRIAGGVEEALELLKDSEGKTIFDLDFSNPEDPNYEKNKLIALNGLHNNVQSHEMMEVNADLLLNIPPNNKKKRSAGQRKKVLRFIKSQFQISVSNLASHAGSHEGIFLFKSLINHSCHPNVLFLMFNEKLVSLVTRPIKAGEQIFDCYGANVAIQAKAARHERLAKYQFKCDCEACINDWPQQFPRKDSSFIVPIFVPLKPAEAIEQFKKNSKYIDENAGKMPCYEVQKLMEHNALYAFSIAGIKLNN